MTNQTNPLARLYDILETVITYTDAHHDPTMEGGVEETTSLRSVWVKAIATGSLEDWEDEHYYDSLIELIRLIDRCQQTVNQSQSISSEDQKLFLDQLARVKEFAFGIHVMDWEDFSEQFTDDFLLALRWAVREMSRHISEPVVPEDELRSLQFDIEELIDKVLESNLSTDLKRSLIEGLRAIHKAIVDYRITGAEGIRETVDRNLGLIVRYRDEIEGVTDAEGKRTLSRYWRIVEKTDRLVSIGKKLLPLAEQGYEGIQKMLGAGS